MRDDDAPKKRGRARAKPTRDARGRWVKGHCPNPKGRPRKKLQEDIAQSDMQHFANTVIDVQTVDGVKKMDRRTALLRKTYEEAMRGKVSLLRFFHKEFERSDRNLAAAKAHYERLMIDWVIENPDFDGFYGKSIPLEVQTEILGLQSVLHHYCPREFPHPCEVAWDDDKDRLANFLRSRMLR